MKKKFIATTIIEYLNENQTIDKWFGNSEVVDEDGNPLVVYHFTNAEFNDFDINKARKSGYFDIDGVGEQTVYVVFNNNQIKCVG